jgi:hypothetical protein
MLSKIVDLTTWQIIVSLPSAICLLAYALWLDRRRGKAWKRSPLLIAMLCLSVSSVGAAIAIDHFQFPKSYVFAFHYIEDREITTIAIFAHAIIVSSLALKLATCTFLAVRFFGNIAGLLIAFAAFWLAGEISGNLLRELALQGWLRRQTASQVELLPYLLEIVLYTLAILVLWISELILLMRNVRVRSTKSKLILAILIFGMVIPLIGFFVLSPWGGFLFFVHLWIALPIILAFGLAIQGQEQFTPGLVVTMFQSVLTALAQMLRTVVDVLLVIVRQGRR